MNIFTRGRLAAVAGLSTLGVLALCVPAFAGTVESAVTAAMGTASTSLLALISDNAPLIIGIAVAMVALGFGIKLVRKMGRG